MANAAEAHSLMQIADMCRSRMRSDGMSFDVLSDLGEFQEMMEGIGKLSNHKPISVAHNDFATEAAIGLLIRRGDDLIGGVAACCIDLGSDSLADHWRRSARRIYGHGRDVVGETCRAAGEIRGRVAYEGELFIAEPYRAHKVNLPAVMHYLHVMAVVTWSPDWLYGFIRHRHASKVGQYGFSGFHLGAQEWVQKADRRCDDECLVTLRPADLAESARFFLRNPAAFAHTGKE